MPAKPHKIAQNRQYKAFMLIKFGLCQYNLAETKGQSKAKNVL